MFADEKPLLDEDLLVHYGIKGMKWGRRRGKGTTGLTRHRGAIIDRNTRQRKMFKDAQKGVGARAPRVAAAIGKKLLGEDRWKRNMKTRISELNDQDRRLRSGRLTIADRIDMTMNVSAIDLLVSRTPK